MAVAAGIIIERYCKMGEKECDKLREEFLKGKYSLEELGKMLGAEKEIMEFFKQQIDIDQKFKIK